MQRPGMWGRMIRTVRNALNGLLSQHGTQLDEESLRTLMCEAEAIVNTQPIVNNGTNSPEPFAHSEVARSDGTTRKIPARGCSLRWRRV